MTTPTLPGSAADAASKEKAPKDKPTSDRMTEAQRAEDARNQADRQETARNKQQPSLGRFVRYVAPDLSERAAIINHVFPLDEEAPPNAPPNIRKAAMHVNLIILPMALQDWVLDRQTELQKEGGVYHGFQIAFDDGSDPRKVHIWRWPVLS